MEFVELRDGKCLTTYSFSSMDQLVVVVVFTRSLPRDGGMAEDHGALKAGQLPEPGTKIVYRERVGREQVPQRFRSWTIQNEMRGVLGRCPQALKEGF